MKLINSTTKKEIKEGDRVTTFRGEKGTLTGNRPPQHEGSTGKVYVKFGAEGSEREYYPSVIGAEWKK